MSISGLVLIGVDGGATEVKAHAVACDDIQAPSTFVLQPEAASRVYIQTPGFEPIPVADQLKQREAGEIELAPKEIAQGRLWTAAAAETIVEVANKCRARRVLIGIGMPGLKTEDGRGIEAINNGPRIPDYLDQVEALLSGSGMTTAGRIAALGSDADYCGLGEEYAEEGLFRGVENAYYVGCGTGVADALKLRGRVTAFDETKTWILKSWQICSALGPTFEKLVSAKSLNCVYANLTGWRGEDQVRYPERAASAGCVIAERWLDTAALALAELIFERIWTVKHGRAGVTFRGHAYPRLVVSHKYRGIELERVIIGQRLGQIYADEAYRETFGSRLERYLEEMIRNGADDEMLSRYLDIADGGLASGFLRASKLRAAPALGAAVAAAKAHSQTKES